MYSENDMDLALTEYMNAIQADYSKFGGKAYTALNITINRGSKFYKVVTGNSVHSFVCRKAHDQWKVGDVLKAASWAQPAKNFIRGNVLSQTYISPVSWAGM